MDPEAHEKEGISDTRLMHIELEWRHTNPHIDLLIGEIRRLRAKRKEDAVLYAARLAEVQRRHSEQQETVRRNMIMLNGMGFGLYPEAL